MKGNGVQMINYVGIDLETSSGDPTTALPIQLGIAYEKQTFEAYINWPWKELSDKWDFKSQKVHGMTRTFVKKHGGNPRSVDRQAYDFVCTKIGDSKWNNIPVGWNVGSFDMAIIKRHLPKLASVLSYRVYDLNTAIMVAHGVQNHNILGATYSLEKIKKHYKALALKQLKMVDSTAMVHNALTDASLALLIKRDLEQGMMAHPITFFQRDMFREIGLLG